MNSAAPAGTTTYTSPTDTQITVTRTFNAPKERVFDAFTSSEHIPHWFTGPAGWTMPVCDIDLRAGGKWRYVYRRHDGKEMSMGGTYKEVDRPNRAVFTEAWEPDPTEAENVLVLTETAGQTTITLTTTYPSKEVCDAARQTGMESGVNASFDRLDALLGRAA